MLIHSHSNWFWINFYKFCHRILNPSCNGNRTPCRNIQIRKLLNSNFGSRINWSPSLICNQIWNFFLRILYYIGNKSLRFPRSCSISNCNNIHIIFCNIIQYFFLRSRKLSFVMHSIYKKKYVICFVKSIFINNYHLTACSISWIQSHKRLFG